MKASSVRQRVTFAINRDAGPSTCHARVRMSVAKRSGKPRSKDVSRGASAGRLVSPAASVGGKKLQREVGAQFFAAASARWRVLVIFSDEDTPDRTRPAPLRRVR